MKFDFIPTKEFEKEYVIVNKETAYRPFTHPLWGLAVEEVGYSPVKAGEIILRSELYTPNVHENEGNVKEVRCWSSTGNFAGIKAFNCEYKITKDGFLITVDNPNFFFDSEEEREKFLSSEEAREKYFQDLFFK